MCGEKTFDPRNVSFLSGDVISDDSDFFSLEPVLLIPSTRFFTGIFPVLSVKYAQINWKFVMGGSIYRGGCVKIKKRSFYVMYPCDLNGCIMA